MIACKLCGASYKTITNSHLKDKHDLTIDAYLSMFPGTSLTSVETLKKRSDASKGKTYEEICGEDAGRALRELKRKKATEQFKDENQRLIRKSKIWKGYGDISGTVWGSYIRGAHSRNFSFSISIEYAWNLYLKQEKKCALSGVPISIDTSLGRLNRHDGSKTTASLDRIDSSKGYDEGNVQWVHKDINKLKMAWPEDYFLEMCTNIVEHKRNSLKN